MVLHIPAVCQCYNGLLLRVIAWFSRWVVRHLLAPLLTRAAAKHKPLKALQLGQNPQCCSSGPRGTNPALNLCYPSDQPTPHYALPSTPLPDQGCDNTLTPPPATPFHSYCTTKVLHISAHKQRAIRSAKIGLQPAGSLTYSCLLLL